MEDFWEWLPYLGVACIPGLINILSAWKELDKQCRFLPFFKPLRSLGFWIWLFLQFLTPALLFWVVVSLQTKPNINLSLIFIALGSGLMFVTLMNATEIGFVPINPKAIYDFLVRIAYQEISSKHMAKTAQFWTELEVELKQSTVNIPGALNYLENYFLYDNSLSDRDKQDHQDRIENARKKTELEEQVKATLIIIKEVRRKDLPTVLRQFKCSDTFIGGYF
jgi:glucan phosphoethanolaminetransferase (alkaline phosphatase superfamily)